MLKLIFKIIHVLISLPVTISLNLKCFPLCQAVRLPVIVDYRTITHGLYKGCIVLPANAKLGLIKIGWGTGSYGSHCNLNSYILFFGKGRLVFAGKAQFAKGVTLRCDNGGMLRFGNNFRANQNFSCFSNTEVFLGDDILAGWNVHIRDSDGHEIVGVDGHITNSNKAINIGNHVWLASHCDVLKGSQIPDGCVVGWRSLVTKKFDEKNCIIAGVPAKVVRQNINWRV